MKSRIIINKNYKIGEIDNRIYGSFIEHIGRAVYSGIYEPTHETANKDGFREDVLELVKKLNVPIVRYPGGNFVSGYNWEDGTGPKDKRPRKLDLAWKSVESNQVGIDEFQQWAKQANTDIMMAVNLGTRGPQEAVNLVEYCNGTADSEYANRRRKNGFEKPFGIKTWCLGNEMDGPWQICEKTAEEYGRIATETAKLMKWADPSIELVASGSCTYEMSTYGSWDYTVLDHLYDHVDYISLHRYYGNTNNNTSDYLGKSVELNRIINDIVAVCDAIKAKKHCKKTINLSLDEWNVWYRENSKTRKDPLWCEAPAVLEEKYNFEDALLIGCMIMTIQNHCDRVKMACLAQLVNVIAPIMTERGGKAWIQTIFYPYYYASKYGRGEALQTVINTDTYETTDGFTVPYLESSVIHNPQNRELFVFAVNRNLEEDINLELNFESFGDVTASEHIELYNDDLKAENSSINQNIFPQKVDAEYTNSKTHEISLKKHSWNMIKFSY